MNLNTNRFTDPDRRYEPDQEVPHWRADVDVAAVYERYALPGPVDIPLLDPDVDYPPMAWMKGRFLPLLSNLTTYCYTFAPGLGEDEAIVLPITEDGRMVDLLAISTDHLAVWGCVTGQGQMAGTYSVGQPVRVYSTVWRWLLFGCEGVVVLSKDAYSPRRWQREADGQYTNLTRVPRLSDASIIIGECPQHAEELADRIFMRPAFDDVPPWLLEHLSSLAMAAEKEAGQRVVVDNGRIDIDRAIYVEAVDQALSKMKRGGLFG